MIELYLYIMSNEIQPWENPSVEELSAWVNDMIERDFSGLLNLLYRLDINENKLRKLLEDIPTEDAGRIIAALIIERQLQKKKSKEMFKQEGEIPEDEKW